MSATRDRTNSIRGWQIPECGQWVWIVKPDPDVDSDRGKGRVCHVRATHTVTYVDAGRVRAEHACLAHLGEVLDWARSRREWQRRTTGVELPGPVIVELTFTADAHAAAYGRTRFIRSERIVTGAIEQALLATQARIPPPPPRRSRTSRPRTGATRSEAVQEPLF